MACIDLRLRDIFWTGSWGLLHVVMWDQVCFCSIECVYLIYYLLYDNEAVEGGNKFVFAGADVDREGVFELLIESWFIESRAEADEFLLDGGDMTMGLGIAYGAILRCMDSPALLLLLLFVLLLLLDEERLRRCCKIKASCWWFRLDLKWSCWFLKYRSSSFAFNLASSVLRLSSSTLLANMSFNNSGFAWYFDTTDWRSVAVDDGEGDVDSLW